MIHWDIPKHFRWERNIESGSLRSVIPPSSNIEKRFQSWEFSKKLISTEFQWNVNNAINNFGVSGLRVTSHRWIRVNGERLPSSNAYPQCGILQWGEISKYSSHGADRWVICWAPSKFDYFSSQLNVRVNLKWSMSK